MTRSSSSRRPRLGWGNAAATLLTAFGCAGQPAPGMVRPSATRVAEAPATEAPATDAPSDPPGPHTTADSVVTLVAKPGLWPLDVDSARRVLQTLGPVKQEQTTPNELSLVGGPAGALDRFDVTYSRDEQQYWVFGSAGFVIAGQESLRLYRLLETRLIQLLGAPASTETRADTQLPSATWDIGEEMTLSLGPSPSGDDRLLMIAISEPKNRPAGARSAP
jgi:hypothetical protein